MRGKVRAAHWISRAGWAVVVVAALWTVATMLGVL